MRFIAYLNFDGQCRAAFDLYREVFDGRIAMRMTYGDSPMRDQVPRDGHDLIMHCRLEVGDAVLMGADGPPTHAPAGQGAHVNIDVDSIDEAERIHAALSAGGTVRTPLQETFWAHRWSMFTDRYGQPWMVNCMKQPE
jgi:PhnB protein